MPVQRPRIPVWVAGEWPHRRPVHRAVHWDGLFPTGMPGPYALAELAGQVRAERAERGDGPFDLIVALPPDQDVRPWAQAGATWVVTDFGLEQSAAMVAEVIEAGPQPVG